MFTSPAPLSLSINDYPPEFFNHTLSEISILAVENKACLDRGCVMSKIVLATMAVLFCISGLAKAELVSCPNVRLIDQEPLGFDAYSVLSDCTSDIVGERKFIFAQYYDDLGEGNYTAGADAVTAAELESAGTTVGTGLFIGEVRSQAEEAVISENMGRQYAGDCSELNPNGVTETYIDDGDKVCIVYWHTNGYRLIFQATGDEVTESGRQTVKDFKVYTDNPIAARSNAIPTVPTLWLWTLCVLIGLRAIPSLRAIRN